MERRIKISTWLLGMWVVCSWWMPAGLDAGSPGVVFWNRLGSDAEVTTSAIGARGTIVGSQYAYEPARHGRGYIRKAVGQYVRFPASILTPLRQRGALALWVTSKVPSPVPYQYGIFGLVGAPYGHYGVPRDAHIGLYWGDTVTGRGLMGSVFFGGQQATTPPEPEQFVAQVGVPFHVAMAWDINGIDGSADTVRLYRDGALVSSSTGTWDPAGKVMYDIILGYGPDGGGYDKFISDNLVIWNYAKTDFSDRFRQDPTGQLKGTIAFLGSDTWPMAEGVNSDIYLMREDGTGLRPFITDPAADFAPAFSPDGARLAFISDRDGEYAVYIVNSDGSGLHMVPNSGYGTSLGGSTGDIVNAVGWSPDGKKLVYRAINAVGGMGIINVDGTARTVLTSNGVGDGVYNALRGMQWGADMDQLIVHAMDYPWHQNIFRYTISSGTWEQMTPDVTPSHTMDAAVNWRGQIAFTRRASGQQLYDLYVMEDIPGAASSNVTRFAVNQHAFQAHWMLGDQKLVFAYYDHQAPNWQIASINPDGSGGRVFSPPGAPLYCMDPTWSSWGPSGAPVALAGADQVICNQLCPELILDGSWSSDKGGEIVSFQWELRHRDNPAYDRTASGVSPVLSDLQPGIYDVTLTVTDNDGLAAEDMLQLTVRAFCDPCALQRGDLDSDGDVDADDLRILGQSFGTRLPGR
ncbi:MAG: PKD domain-containing protein [Thermodesulfobacteriota bacterium]